MHDDALGCELVAQLVGIGMIVGAGECECVADSFKVLGWIGNKTLDQHPLGKQYHLAPLARVDASERRFPPNHCLGILSQSLYSGRRKAVEVITRLKLIIIGLPNSR
jgi:hypothetical protein